MKPATELQDHGAECREIAEKKTGDRAPRAHKRVKSASQNSVVASCFMSRRVDMETAPSEVRHSISELNISN